MRSPLSMGLLSEEDLCQRRHDVVRPLLEHPGPEELFAHPADHPLAHLVAPPVRQFRRSLPLGLQLEIGARLHAQVARTDAMGLRVGLPGDVELVFVAVRIADEMPAATALRHLSAGWIPLGHVVGIPQEREDLVDPRRQYGAALNIQHSRRASLSPEPPPPWEPGRPAL